MASTETDYDSLRLISVEELCDLFKVRKSWVYDAVEDGSLPTIRLGRQLRFREIDLAAFLHQAATDDRGGAAPFDVTAVA